MGENNKNAYVVCQRCRTKVYIDKNIEDNNFDIYRNKDTCDIKYTVPCTECMNDILVKYIHVENSLCKDVISKIKYDNDNKLKPTIVFDFDGVIHSYNSGWVREDIVPDGLVEGIDSVIEMLKTAGYKIVIQSSRARTERGLKAIKDFLDEYNITVDNITSDKVPALLYIDDNGYRFNTFKPNNIQSLIGFLEENNFI